MKKVYVKPTVEIESYELNEFVASCENTTPNHSRADCVIDLGPWTVFALSVCDEVPEEDGQYNGFCYHIPVESAQFFGS